MSIDSESKNDIINQISELTICYRDLLKKVWKARLSLRIKEIKLEKLFVIFDYLDSNYNFGLAEFNIPKLHSEGSSGELYIEDLLLKCAVYTPIWLHEVISRDL